LAHVPEALRAFEQFSAAVRATPLDATVRELVILRVSMLLGNEYEWRRHCVAAQRCGVPDSQIEALSSWETSSAFDPALRAILSFVDSHVLHNDVDPSVVLRLKDVTGDAGVVGLALVVGWYLLVSTVIQPLGLMQDDTAAAAPISMPPSSEFGRSRDAFSEERQEST
jgi:alkylhydroperoxidase family enzyme